MDLRPAPMLAPHHVLRAEVPALLSVLRAAFLDDPMFAWMCPDVGQRAGALDQFFGATLDLAIAKGHAYVTDDLQAAALWAPPEVELYEGPAMERIEAFFRETVAERAELVLTGMLQLFESHPTEPHFYLGVIGTHPSAQGRGLGGQLLRSVLDGCDANGTAAYLESSNIRNVAFYERHGFRITAEVEMPEGPVMRPMWRDPLVPAR